MGSRDEALNVNRHVVAPQRAVPIQAVVIGGCSIDYVTTALGDVTLAECGGSAVYSAVAARLWMEGVGIVSWRGETYPQAWIDRLQRSGIDCSGVATVTGPHAVALPVRYDSMGRRQGHVPIERFEAMGIPVPEALGNAVANWNTNVASWSDKANAAQVPDNYRNVGAVLVTTAVLRTSVRDQIRSLKAGGAAVLLDVALDPLETYTPHEDQLDLKALLKDVDIFLPSESDVYACLGKTEPLKAATFFATQGPSIVVLKRGRHGSIVFDAESGQVHDVPVYPSKVKDPTGAGDAYCGGFLAGYLETGDPFEAALYGTVAASYIVEEFGALYGLRYGRSDALERLNWLRSELVAAG